MKPTGVNDRTSASVKGRGSRMNAVQENRQHRIKRLKTALLPKCHHDIEAAAIRV